MANELATRIINVEFTIELPAEHAYTNGELIDTLNLRSIQSPYPEIKVVDVKEVGEDAEDAPEKLLFTQIHESYFPKDVLRKLWHSASFHGGGDGSCMNEYMVAVYKLPRIAEALQRYKDKTLSKFVSDLYEKLKDFQYLHVTKA